MNSLPFVAGESLRISVALCTYNGAQFLAEQLDSIARQTRLPDEVLIRDDRSRDDTVRIVEEWSVRVPFRVRAEINAENLGSSRNFARAIAEARGDVIVLSDQDDLWLPEKLARITQFFEDHPTAEAVFTDGWVVDSSLRKQQRLSQCVGFQGPKIKQAIADDRVMATLAERATATGATMALRARLRDAILPLPEPFPRSLIHDGWIAIVAALRGTLGFIDEPLILYRQHVRQQVGVQTARVPGQPRWRSGPARARILSDAAADAVLLVDILRARFPDLTVRLLPFEQRRQHQCLRRDLPSTLPRRLLPVLREWLGGRYHRFSHGTRTALGDLLG